MFYLSTILTSSLPPFLNKELLLDLDFVVIGPDDRLTQIKIGLHKAFCYYF